MLKRLKSNAAERESKRVGGKKIALLFLLIAVTMTVYAVYRFLMQFYYFEITLAIYMVLCTAFILTYVIYNRGMSRKGITAEMLPPEWSEEQKETFIEDGKRRLKRSQWMLIPIFAFLFTFALDAIELFVLPFIADLLTK